MIPGARKVTSRNKSRLSCRTLFLVCQAEHVAMEICTTKAMEQTLQPSAQPCSTAASVAVHATRSGARTTRNGASQDRSWSLPPTSARRTMLSRATQAAGATLPFSTLTSLSLCSSTSLGTELESYPLPTKGKRRVHHKNVSCAH